MLEKIKKIRCPICSSAYQHAHTPQSLFYPEDFFIPFSGECGCKWGIVFEFCKGDTLPYVRILRSCNEETKLEDRIDTLTFDTESFWKNLKLEFI